VRHCNILRRREVEKLIARGDQIYDNHMHAGEALSVGLIETIFEGSLNIFD